jgi:hypothetical protein
MLYSGGPKEPITVDLVLFAILPALVLSVYVLPFWLIAGVFTYFTLRPLQLLGAAPYALVGLGVGETTAWVLVVDFSRWAIAYAVVGVVSGLAGYCALRLLARPPAFAPGIDVTNHAGGGRLAKASSVWSRTKMLVAAVVSAAVGTFVVYDALANFIPKYDKLVVAKGPAIVGAKGSDFLLDNGEVWLYPVRLPSHREPPRSETSDFRQLTLRASPHFGRHAYYNYKLARSVREIYEVGIGSRQFIRYEDVVAAKRDSAYPSPFYFGIVLIGLGFFFAVRYAYTRRRFTSPR